MTKGKISKAIAETREAIMAEVSAVALTPRVQQQIRDALTEALGKAAVVAAREVLRPEQRAWLTKRRENPVGFLDDFFARSPDLHDSILRALEECRLGITRQISDRLAASVKAGVL